MHRGSPHAGSGRCWVPKAPALRVQTGSNPLQSTLAPQGGQGREGEAVLVQPTPLPQKTPPMKTRPSDPTESSLHCWCQPRGAVVTEPHRLGTESNFHLSQSGGWKSRMQVWTGLRSRRSLGHDPAHLFHSQGS